MTQRCPYCTQPTYAEYVDVGVGGGGVQVTPHSCWDCQATEAGPYCDTDQPDYDPSTGWFIQPQPKKDNAMHSSRTIFLANPNVIALTAYYENSLRPETFKTMQTGIAPGDLIVAESNGKHGHSILKVVEVGVQIDYASSDPVKWVTGLIDKEGYKALLAQEAKLVDLANAAKAERMRKDIFGDADVSSVFESLPPPTPTDPPLAE